MDPLSFLFFCFCFFLFLSIFNVSHCFCGFKLNNQSSEWYRRRNKLFKKTRGFDYTIDDEDIVEYITERMDPNMLLEKLAKEQQEAQPYWTETAGNEDGMVPYMSHGNQYYPYVSHGNRYNQYSNPRYAITSYNLWRFPCYHPGYGYDRYNYPHWA